MAGGTAEEEEELELDLLLDFVSSFGACRICRVGFSLFSHRIQGGTSKKPLVTGAVCVMATISQLPLCWKHRLQILRLAPPSRNLGFSYNIT